MPAPKVDSAVIRLNVLSDSPVIIDNEEKFFAVVKAAFSQRRKILANSLCSGLSLDKAKVFEILRECGIPENIRAEKLSLQNFADIANCLR